MLVKALAPLFAFLLNSARAAKTDLAGCTLTIVPLLTKIVTTTAADGQVSSFGDFAQSTFQWDGTEQCQLIDCGGGRAPPKTNVPGCPLYTGTDTVPSLPFPTASLTLNDAAAPATTPAGSATSTGASVAATPAATSSSPQATNTNSSSEIPNSSGLDASGSVTPTPTDVPSGGTPAAASATTTASPSGSSSTASSNDGQRLCGRWEGALAGFAAVAVAALHFP